MKKGRIGSIMVATLLFCVPSGSTAWAKQGTPSAAEGSVK